LQRNIEKDNIVYAVTLPKSISKNEKTMKKFLQLLMTLVLITTVFLLSAPQENVGATPLQATWKWYDRQKAVDYAMKWKTLRNVPAWYDYKPAAGGDCTNFVSQALNAGGIPEDKAGSAQWYWDNNGLPNTPPTSGKTRSSSWSGVQPFFDYIVVNKNGNGPNGPIGDVNVAREKMEKGDVIQFDWKDKNGKYGTWDHTAIVVKTEWQGWWIFKTYKVWVVYHDTDTPAPKDLDDLLKNGKARYIKIWGYNAP
jgi:hypothetical protein